jgi:2'-hydroxyisoflavone reductase
MKILIIGGTVFLGRALVDSALERGHSLTLFNRRQSHPDLFPHIEQITGDRTTDLDRLSGRTWDAIIDTCGYLPRIVGLSAQALSGSVSQYVFISTCSVYADTTLPGVDESAPPAALPDNAPDQIIPETYGPYKWLCEKEVWTVFSERALILRPGLIIGPHDPSGRFTYWPLRIARGGRVLAPGRPQRKIQWIDVRDLADWTIRLLEIGAAGVYNAVGPESPIPMQTVLEACQLAAGSEATFTWVTDEFLLANEVGAWMEMPLWLPESDPDSLGFFAFSNRKAIASGLTFRPLVETIRDTIEWASLLPPDPNPKTGLPPQREAELLAKWDSGG